MPKIPKSGLPNGLIELPRKRRFPPRLGGAKLTVDLSGSTRVAHAQARGFVDNLRASLIEADPRAADAVFVALGVVSGGLWLSDFVPLGELAWPEAVPGGTTPLGTAAGEAAAEMAAVYADVEAQGCHLVQFLDLWVSDFVGTGETAAAADAGYAAHQKWLADFPKHRVKLVATTPDFPEAAARRLVRPGDPTDVTVLGNADAMSKEVFDLLVRELTRLSAAVSGRGSDSAVRPPLRPRPRG